MMTRSGGWRVSGSQGRCSRLQLTAVGKSTRHVRLTCVLFCHHTKMPPQCSICKGEVSALPQSAEPVQCCADRGSKQCLTDPIRQCFFFMFKSHPKIIQWYFQVYQLVGKRTLYRGTRLTPCSPVHTGSVTHCINCFFQINHFFPR